MERKAIHFSLRVCFNCLSRDTLLQNYVLNLLPGVCFWIAEALLSEYISLWWGRKKGQLSMPCCGGCGGGRERSMRLASSVLWGGMFPSDLLTSGSFSKREHQLASMLFLVDCMLPGEVLIMEALGSSITERRSHAAR